MSIKRAGKKELKEVAQQLCGLLVADLRDELAELRETVSRLQDSIVALHVQNTAVQNRLDSELQRSARSREAILKRLAEVENAARSVS